MFIDGRTLPRDTKATADVCIIGAGPAGITLARKLASDKLSVICIESGGREPDIATQDLTKGEIVGLPYYPLNTTRLRYFGGTSGHWGGYCRPFDPIDFETRSWVPHSGWPIDYASVAEHYNEAQDICDLGPFDYSPEGWELGAMQPLKLSGNAVKTRLIQFSPPTRFGTKYQDEFARSKNIAVYLYSNVVSIDAAVNGKEVAQLSIKTLSGNSFTAQAKIYVLAAGGIENARLLLASSQVMKSGLLNDRDLVGRYFSDHMQLDAAAVMPIDQSASFDLYQLNTRHIPVKPRAGGGHTVGVMGYLTLTEEAQRSGRTLNYSANVIETFWSDYFLHPQRADASKLSGWEKFGDAMSNVWDNLKEATASAWQRLPGRTPPKFYKVVTSQEQAPNPESRIVLADQTDALGMRRAALNWQLTDLDRHTISFALQQIGLAMGGAGIARLNIPVDFTKDPWPDHILGSWHHCGGTRMSGTPESGVVDANCKAHGMANLYVAGSSVFPTNGHGNPTLTLVALSLRLANHLRSVVR